MSHTSNHTVHNRYIRMDGVTRTYDSNSEDEFMVDDYEDIDLDIQEWMLINSPDLYERFYDNKKPQ